MSNIFKKFKISKNENQNQNQTKNQNKEEVDPEINYQPVNWKKLLMSPKYIPIYIIAIGLLVATILLSFHSDDVVKTLRPVSEKIRHIRGGFLIPIVILIIISFPPLFGHEVIALLCGVVWGLWIGFAIVAAGTFIGELGTWFAFKYALRRRAEKLERTNLNFAALARLSREGGFLIVLIIRLSAIPSHFSTAVFSTCNIRFWSFAIATFISLPKQITLVYFGTLFVQNKSGGVVKTLVVTLAAIATIGMAGYIYWRMRIIKKVLLEEQTVRQLQAEKELKSEFEV